MSDKTIEKIEIKEENNILLKVELPLRGEKEKKKDFIKQDAIKYLEQNGYKNKIGKSLSTTIVSNVSDKRRKGIFIFRLKEQIPSTTRRSSAPVDKNTQVELASGNTEPIENFIDEYANGKKVDHYFDENTKKLTAIIPEETKPIKKKRSRKKKSTKKEN